MSIFRKVLGTLAGAVLAMMFLATPASAHTGSPPQCGYYDGGASYGATCYEWDGDDQWVYDAASNGRGVGVEIYTNYDKFRRCENTHGAGTWHECQFDHRENTCVTFRLYERNSSGTSVDRFNYTAWSQWVNTATGNPC